MAAATSSKSFNGERLFGLRIENRLIQLAIGDPLGDGRYQITLDERECTAASGWLKSQSPELLTAALEDLQRAHEIRRHPVAISLDGDFCVTRVTTGSPQQVDRDLSLLNQRIQRYLKLGPGGKVIGQTRIKLEPTVDYAMTGVANGTLIQLLYESIRNCDLNVVWVEPSLVSLSRLSNYLPKMQDQSLLIADGAGDQWDVGLASEGRLLLDYRPSAAKDVDTLCRALESHFSRLKRFCARHRQITENELNQLLVCGDDAKIDDAVRAFSDNESIEATAMTVPAIPDVYEVDPNDRGNRSVPAVASILPLLTGQPVDQIVDLLQGVRRDRGLSRSLKCAITFLPAVAASLILAVVFGLLTYQRNHMESYAKRQAEVQEEFNQTIVQMNTLGKQRVELNYLQIIQENTREPDWTRLFDRVTSSLPTTLKLDEFRVDSGKVIRLTGTSVDDGAIYELVNHLRRLPGIDQVALKGTNPVTNSDETRFRLRLTTGFQPSADVASVPHSGARK
ncbi:MAG: hypothetical protein AAGA03_09990 [Planctomycetota bacterium]